MLTRETISALALELPGAYLDTPFESHPGIVVFRHGAGGKWFGVILRAPCAAVGLSGEGTIDVLDLKCDPLAAYGFIEAYPDIVPGYHMNKQHWITIRMSGHVPDDTLRLLIGMSYDLTRPKPKKPRRRP